MFKSWKSPTLKVESDCVDSKPQDAVNLMQLLFGQVNYKKYHKQCYKGKNCLTNGILEIKKDTKTNF